MYQTVDTGHEDIIHDAQMNYYGTTLATCSSDEVIKLFNVKDKKQKLIAELRGHQGPVWGLSWSHPIHGNLLASCSYDRSVIVWMEHEGKWEKFYEYKDHKSSVNTVAWAPHEYGLVLACGSSDGIISILTYTSAGNWDSTTIPDAHASGVNAVSWAPAINADFILNPSLSQTACGLLKRIVSGGCDCLVKIWREDPSSGGWVKEAQLEGGHTEWVRDVAWCPSLSLARQQIASCGQDGCVIVWQSLRRRVGSDVNATGLLGTAVEGAAEEVWKPVVLATYPDVVWHVSWSLTGNILAVSGGDNKVTLWKENLEGAWVILSEVARGRQTNTTSSGSGAGVGYGATSTTIAAAREPASSTRDSMGGVGVSYNRTSMDSPSLQPRSGAAAPQAPMAFYDHSTAPVVTTSAPVAP